MRELLLKPSVLFFNFFRIRSCWWTWWLCTSVCMCLQHMLQLYNSSLPKMLSANLNQKYSVTFSYWIGMSWSIYVFLIKQGPRGFRQKKLQKLRPDESGTQNESWCSDLIDVHTSYRLLLAWVLWNPRQIWTNKPTHKNSESTELLDRYSFWNLIHSMNYNKEEEENNT